MSKAMFIWELSLTKNIVRNIGFDNVCGMPTTTLGLTHECQKQCYLHSLPNSSTKKTTKEKSNQLLVTSQEEQTSVLLFYPA